MSKALATIEEYAPPLWEQRAWEPDGRDDWILDAMRHGFTDALEAAVRMDERDPELRRQVGVEGIRFRSNRLPIDTDIVERVWPMEPEDVEKQAQWRRDNAEQLTAYPRAVLDAFAADITYAVEAAGRWDRQAAERWQAHREAVAEPVNRWRMRLNVEAPEASVETRVWEASQRGNDTVIR